MSAIYVVGLSVECKPLARFSSEDRAARWITERGDGDDGRYYIDGPCYFTPDQRAALDARIARSQA